MGECCNTTHEVRIGASGARLAYLSCYGRCMLTPISAGEMFIVPKGVEHKPYAEHEVKLLLIEPRGVPNTGHEGGERTAQNDVWI